MSEEKVLSVPLVNRFDRKFKEVHEVFGQNGPK